MSQIKPITIPTNYGNEFTFPLDEFYNLDKREIPPINPIDKQHIPEPYKSLLVHERDMTSTLGQFYNDEIQLKVIKKHQQLKMQNLKIFIIRFKRKIFSYSSKFFIFFMNIYIKSQAKKS